MVAVNYDWDELEDNIDEEYDDSGSTLAEYTTEPEKFGHVISQRRGGESSFLHCDGLGSTLALTNAPGLATDTYAYSAFGEVTEQIGSTVNPLQYVGNRGYYNEGRMQDVFVRARIFGARLARWLARDPIGYLDYAVPLHSTHLAGRQSQREKIAFPYVYARNSPTVLVDPAGRWPAAQWSRKRLAGPVGLNDRRVSYEIEIGHVVPLLPDMALNVFQVWECNVLEIYLTDNGCTRQNPLYHHRDIADVDRKLLTDTLTDPCIVNVL